MSRIAYDDWAPRADAIDIVAKANQVCLSYARQGYDLTLRQLYYQFVSRGWLPNNQLSYNKLKSIISKARLAGLLSWSYIVDRTRNLSALAHWDDPAEIMGSAAAGFRIEKWSDQPTRVEVWVEKEALSGVVARTANDLDVAWFACRGYVSQSELWRAGQRLGGYIRDGKRVVILHLGDHDPSGIDMTRDIDDRLRMFIGHDVGYGAVDELEVRRIALNMEQVRLYNPPPNPAKLTDSRVGNYIDLHGEQSWELDALDPATLDALIRQHVYAERDDELWGEAEALEAEHRRLLREASDRWTEVAAYLNGDE